MVPQLKSTIYYYKLTSSGIEQFLFTPVPSCPSIPLPQEYILPSVDNAHKWKDPDSTLLTSGIPDTRIGENE